MSTPLKCDSRNCEAAFEKALPDGFIVIRRNAAFVDIDSWVEWCATKGISRWALFPVKRADVSLFRSTVDLARFGKNVRTDRDGGFEMERFDIL